METSNRKMSEHEMLQEVCEPLCKLLQAVYDPHTYVVVSQESIKLMRVDTGIPVNVQD